MFVHHLKLWIKCRDPAHPSAEPLTTAAQNLFTELSPVTQELQHMNFPSSFPPVLLLNLLSRIGREKTPQLFDTFLLFFSVTQKAEHQQNLLKPAALCNVVALSKHKIWLSSFLEMEHPVLLIIWPGSGWWHFPVSWPLLACQNPAHRVSAGLREMRKDLLAHLAGTINPQTGHLTWQIYCKHTQNPMGKQVHKDFKAKLLPDQLTNVLVSFHAQDQGKLPVVRMNAYK